MSKEIDPNDLSKDDVEYIRQRPNLRREFVLQGFGDPLESDYPGLNFSPDQEEEETEDEGEDDSSEDYEDWTKDRLKSEIDRRNADREDDDKIVPQSNKNAALAFALREDDKDSSDQ